MLVPCQPSFASVFRSSCNSGRSVLRARVPGRRTSTTHGCLPACCSVGAPRPCARVSQRRVFARMASCDAAVLPRRPASMAWLSRSCSRRTDQRVKNT
uniref:Uncharacterized protein n=1 Tax=uncultured marine virus TaxID=186617 RepID=A0A0F7L5D8_9VIRU|nr:hypothetical protein [uncultured marine virus]